MAECTHPRDKLGPIVTDWKTQQNYRRCGVCGEKVWQKTYG